MNLSSIQVSCGMPETRCALALLYTCIYIISLSFILSSSPKSPNKLIIIHHQHNLVDTCCVTAFVEYLYIHVLQLCMSYVVRCVSDDIIIVIIIIHEVLLYN